MFKNYKLEIGNQLSKKIKIIKSESSELEIVHQIITHHSFQSNENAECNNWTLKKMMIAVLINSRSSKNL